MQGHHIDIKNFEVQTEYFNCIVLYILYYSKVHHGINTNRCATFILFVDYIPVKDEQKALEFSAIRDFATELVICDVTYSVCYI